MSKIVRVVLEFDDVVKIATGQEANKFESNLLKLTMFANEHDFNPFNDEKINWETYKKEEDGS